MERINNYKVLSSLGSGSFGVVSLVQSSASGNTYAAKVSSGNGKPLLISEANIHSRLTHPNIVQFVTSFDITFCPQNPLIPVKQGDCGVVLLEYCKEGTLENILRKYGRLSKSQFKLLIRSMASVLIYLREQGIIHRDVKPDNILFCNKFAKLADFGIAMFAQKAKLNPAIGTPNYMAYESYTGEYAFATDVYALGVTLYYAYTAQIPFTPPTQETLTKNFIKRKVSFQGKIDDKYRMPDLEDLIAKMLQLRADDRITPKMILQHPFLRNTDDVVMDLSDESELGELETFRKMRIDFGAGTREQFYYYVANKDPNNAMMPISKFIELWDNL